MRLGRRIRRRGRICVSAETESETETDAGRLRFTRQNDVAAVATQLLLENVQIKYVRSDVMVTQNSLHESQFTRPKPQSITLEPQSKYESWSGESEYYKSDVQQILNWLL